jgi:hypothetical protein
VTESAPTSPASAAIEGPAPGISPPAISVSALPEALPARTAAALSSPKAAGDLAAERRLLGVARAALARENGVDALAACDEHARRFSAGMLAEEREAIAVQALVQSDRLEEARSRGERFRQDHPKSILLPAVLAALKSDP